MNTIDEYFSQLSEPFETDIKPFRRTNVTEWDDADVVALMDRIIEEALRRGASDIHIESRKDDRPLVRLRIDGQLQSFVSLPPIIRDNLVSRIKVISSLDISVKLMPQDGKFSYTSPNHKDAVNVRVATFPTIGQLEDIVLRILPPGKPIPINQIGLLPYTLKELIRLIESPHGLFLICGPTGSGKTTTLHSILHYRNNPDTKIWTAEDPVEVVQEGLRQIQVNPKTGFDYATALRAFLRGDPDVIMIGEMRDRESITIGLEASLTGHLVLSTVHTNTAVESITRFSNMGVNEFTLADGLLGVLSQRLTRTLCSRCKEPYKPDKIEIQNLINIFTRGLGGLDLYRRNGKEFLQKLYEFWRTNYGEDGSLVLYKPKGCSLCDHGYRGRMAIHELFVNSTKTRKLINTQATTQEIYQLALNQGMVSLSMDAVIKTLQGRIDLQQLSTVTF